MTAIATIRQDRDVDHGVRLLEAETAESYSIPFNDEWYSIDVISREHMVAARLAVGWIESLSMEKAVNNARSKS